MCSCFIQKPTTILLLLQLCGVICSVYIYGHALVRTSLMWTDSYSSIMALRTCMFEDSAWLTCMQHVHVYMYLNKTSSCREFTLQCIPHMCMFSTKWTGCTYNTPPSLPPFPPSLPSLPSSQSLETRFWRVTYRTLTLTTSVTSCGCWE